MRPADSSRKYQENIRQALEHKSFDSTLAYVNPSDAECLGCALESLQPGALSWLQTGFVLLHYNRLTPLFGLRQLCFSGPILASNVAFSGDPGCYHRAVKTRAYAHAHPYGEKTRPGDRPEQQLFAQRQSMINQAREVFATGDSRHP